MLKLYPQILSSLSRVSEQKSVYPSLTERHLQVAWLEQKFFKCLVTSEEEKVEVISPGIWNKQAGPDFLKAHLRIGQREYRGDIEIHLHDQGWYQHGHHEDSRYNQVILHLSFDSLQTFPIYKENGQKSFSCYLTNSIQLAIKEWASLIDFECDSGEKLSTKGYCGIHLFPLLSDKQIKNLFQSAAYWRLEKKLNELQQSVSNRSLQFIAGIAMALGYKNNTKAFLELFNYLIDYRDLPYDELVAIALGCCGFLEENRHPVWEKCEYYQLLCHLWWSKKNDVIHQAYLKLDRIRPLHHPIRRLAYLAHLLQDQCLEQIWPTLLLIWEKAIAEPVLPLRSLKKKLLNILPIYQDDYWDFHYTFELNKQAKRLPSIGKELHLHLLLNTTLPLLYAKVKEARDFQIWEKFQQFYLSLEAPSNSKTDYLHRRFLGDLKDKSYLRQAQMTQGAYQLHQDFCSNFESSCQGCPFTERYHALN